MSENQPIFSMKSLSFGPIARPDSRPPSVFTQLGQRRQLKHFFLALAGLNRIGRLRMPRACDIVVEPVRKKWISTRKAHFHARKVDFAMALSVTERIVATRDSPIIGDPPASKTTTPWSVTHDEHRIPFLRKFKRVLPNNTRRQSAAKCIQRDWRRSGIKVNCGATYLRGAPDSKIVWRATR